MNRPHYGLNLLILKVSPNASAIREFLLAFVLVLLTSIYTPLCAQPREYTKPEDVVAWLYRDYAWEAIMADARWPTLIDQPGKILSRYFCDELASLIQKDRECVRRTQELCSLNFNPIFASQDAGALDLTVSPRDRNSIVRVQFRHPSNQKVLSLDFKVEKPTGNWRITDIIYENGNTLRKILQRHGPVKD